MLFVGLQVCVVSDLSSVFRFGDAHCREHEAISMYPYHLSTCKIELLSWFYEVLLKSMVFCRGTHDCKRKLQICCGINSSVQDIFNGCLLNYSGVVMT